MNQSGEKSNFVRVFAAVSLIFGLLLTFARCIVSNELAGMGQFGDTLGGISNFITMVVVVSSAIYATRQFAQFREQHSHEVKATIALEVWRGSHAHVIELLRTIENIGDGPHAQWPELKTDAQFSRCVGEADLALFKNANVVNALDWLLATPRVAVQLVDRAHRGRSITEEKQELARWVESLGEFLRDELWAYVA